MQFFTEIRLQASVACRAWTADRGCHSAAEWEAELATLPLARAVFERARLRVSETLAVDGVDPLGIGRVLLIHESAAPLSRAALREVGFVHLEAASGIHLYAVGRAIDFALARVAERAGWTLRWTAFLRVAVPPAVAALVFGLTGFRPGLLRPLALVGMRGVAARFGFRWTRAAPIFVALALDAVFGFLLSFGTERAFAEWAPGELHYATAWWGGILGYEWARSRGYGAFRAHFALSVGSWFAVLPLDLADGRFAPATPFLSLLTVEVLARGGYLALLGGACLVGFTEASPGVREGFEWLVVFLNRGVGALFAFLVQAGVIREIPEGLGLPLAFGMGVAVSAFALQSRGISGRKDENNASYQI